MERHVYSLRCAIHVFFLVFCLRAQIFDVLFSIYRRRAISASLTLSLVKYFPIFCKAEHLIVVHVFLCTPQGPPVRVLLWPCMRVHMCLCECLCANLCALMGILFGSAEPDKELESGSRICISWRSHQNGWIMEIKTQPTECSRPCPRATYGLQVSVPAHVGV